MTAALLALLALVGAMPRDTTPRIREWPVPWAESRPRDPAVAADGRVWFVGQVGNYVAVLDPRTGEFTRTELPAGAFPHNVVVGPDRALWYAGNGDAHIGRLDPATGEIRRFDLHDPSARDPHTLVFGPGGELWFTVQGGNAVGRLDPATGTVRLVRPGGERTRPYGITVGPDGRPWIALFGTNRLATIDPATMAMREYPLPWADARPRRVERTAEGMVWYVDYARGSLGRLDPATGEVREWPAPAGAESRPYALAVDDRDRLWLVETGPQPNRLVGFDPATGRFTTPVAIPSGAGTVRHMIYHRPSRTLWFGTDANTVGQAALP
jgi:virginiamycin B lyase